MFIFFDFLSYIIRLLPFLFSSIRIDQKNKQLFFNLLDFNDLSFFLYFVSRHSLLKFKTLIGLTAIDFVYDSKRFKLVYFLLSYLLNMRCIVTFRIDELSFVESSINIFKNAVWYEREVWDFFGIFFSNNPDLRRILTDYGFDGYPFRKDFPLMGYTQLKFSFEHKHLVYERVELSQEYRFFNFLSPWNFL